jgi:hypothetical protein
MQGQGAETEAIQNKAGNLKLGESARLLLASGPDRAALEALRDEIAARIAALSLTQSRAPLVFLYQSMVIWLLERRFVVPWDNRMTARVQMWEIEWFNPVLAYQKQFVRMALAAFADAPGFKMMDTILRAIPDDSVGFVDNRQKDVTMYRRPGAKLTIIGFSGLNHQIAGIGWTSFDRAVAAKLNANLIVFKDFKRRLYLAGVTSIGDYAATIAYLRRLLAEFADTRIVALGGSGGVFGAIHIACELGLDHVVALPGPTSLKIGEGAEDKQVYQKIAEDAKAGLIAYPDLVERVNGAGLRRIDFFVGGQHAFDYAQMRNLADGCACVVPHVYKDHATHTLIDKCIADGSLIRAFEADASQVR